MYSRRRLTKRLATYPGLPAYRTTSSDRSDHDTNLTAVLERPRATGLCFNDRKMVVRCKRIPFFGNIIGADGIEAYPEKVTAICNMTAPTDVNELQTFLGWPTILEG